MKEGFLVLERRNHEELVLFCGDEEITVRVMAIKGDKIRLGTKASRNVTIWRRELLTKEREENRRAALRKAALGRVSA